MIKLNKRFKTLNLVVVNCEYHYCLQRRALNYLQPAYVCAVVNIYFGMTLPSSGFTPLATRYLLLAFIGVFVLVEVVLEINKCFADKKDRGRH